MDGDSDQVGKARDAINAADQAYTAAVEAIGAINNPGDRQCAFELAGDLADRTRRWAEDAAKLRQSRIREIWEAEKLSLAKLADRVGVSKTRADQLVKIFKADQRGGDR